MKAKRITSLILALALALSLCLTGCGSQCGDTQEPAGENTGSDDAKYTVGICQLVQHDALDAAASATSDIPILGTSITAYGVALDMDDFNGTVGGNISGTSDLADLEKQAAMITEWFPQAKKVALLFCSAEPNSRYQIEEVAKHLADAGIETAEYAFTDTNDVASVTQAACDYADVIYIPTDNTAAANTEAIANVLIPAGVPAICGEEGICSGCGVATLSISYYDLGKTTGQMAARILTGEADISTMPIEYTTATPKYNPTICEALGITPLDGYTAIED